LDRVKRKVVCNVEENSWWSVSASWGGWGSASSLHSRETIESLSRRSVPTPQKIETWRRTISMQFNPGSQEIEPGVGTIFWTGELTTSVTGIHTKSLLFQRQ
jgi:hypothetical protein